MRALIDSVQAEFLRYKQLGEGAIAQVPDDRLSYRPLDTDNSIPVICWHLSGNLRSRFTEFLTADGEKPWRNRDEEFVERAVTRNELLETWNAGWAVLLTTLSELDDADLERVVAIRGEEMRVYQALLRSLAHTSYHVGQIVYLAKSLAGAGFRSLSIPRADVKERS
jgi:uncharacterized damage-inducible protein DinB